MGWVEKAVRLSDQALAADTTSELRPISGVLKQAKLVAATGDGKITTRTDPSQCIAEQSV